MPGSIIKPLTVRGNGGNRGIVELICSIWGLAHAIIRINVGIRLAEKSVLWNSL